MQTGTWYTVWGLSRNLFLLFKDCIGHVEMLIVSPAWWLTLVIPVHRETEAGGSQIGVHSWKLVGLCLKIKYLKKAGDVAQCQGSGLILSSEENMPMVKSS